MIATPQAVAQEREEFGDSRLGPRAMVPRPAPWCDCQQDQLRERAADVKLTRNIRCNQGMVYSCCHHI
jgi:hypothetical protein